MSESKRRYRPRSVNGAARHGWHVVRIAKQQTRSYIGVLIEIDRMIQGRYINQYDWQGGGTLAFELAEDATLVNLQYNFFRK